ncbi:hypothetical protein [Nonomuraea jabiensis]|uniref:hypothetical protein n=1 Tax=Nonomuraea jabiensis TaxID=882448 RepID=UPI0036C141F8
MRQVARQAYPEGVCESAVVEDVVTSGGQIVLSTAELRSLGAQVSEALCVIDREQGGAAAGIGLSSLLTATDLRTTS